MKLEVRAGQSEKRMESLTNLLVSAEAEKENAAMKTVDDYNEMKGKKSSDNKSNSQHLSERSASELGDGSSRHESEDEEALAYSIIASLCSRGPPNDKQKSIH